MPEAPGAPPPEPLTRWAASREGAAVYLNASAVAFDSGAIVLLGAPGSGKSTTAIGLLAHGARLIADDGVWVSGGVEGSVVDRPASARDLIEVRGVGLLDGGPVIARAPLALVVDLDRAEPDRLPPRRTVAMGAHEVPLILGAGRPFLVAALRHMMQHGRAVP